MMRLGEGLRSEHLVSYPVKPAQQRFERRPLRREEKKAEKKPTGPSPALLAHREALIPPSSLHPPPSQHISATAGDLSEKPLCPLTVQAMKKCRRMDAETLERMGVAEDVTLLHQYPCNLLSVHTFRELSPFPSRTSRTSSS